MERHEEISPETIPYWNYIKDASPKVRNEFVHLLIHVPNVTEDSVVDDLAGSWGVDSLDDDEFISICEGARHKGERDIYIRFKSYEKVFARY